MTSFAPFERVRDASGSRGTVRYVGPVATSKNACTVWVGVEWDDVTRGKHDGAVEKDGVETRYFRCPAGAGSFVKPSKLMHGENFLTALKERYQKTDGPAADELYVPTMRGNKVAIELKESARVTRRQQIDRNENISLEHSDVARAGEDGHIREEAANIVVLNMVGTMLHSWDEVGRIARQLPRLERLDLGSNRLQPMRDPPAAWLAPPPAARPFDQLAVLVLNRTATPWAWVQRLHDAGCLPLLEELHLCTNGISSFAGFGDGAGDAGGAGGADEDDAAAANGALAAARAAATAKVAGAGGDGAFVRGFQRLHTLVLNDNAFSAWAQLRPLSRLPCLRNLALNGNQLEQIEPRTAHLPAVAAPGTDAGAGSGATAVAGEAKGASQCEGEGTQASGGGYFDSLVYVSLSHNRIAQWEHVDNLATYPRFAALRCLANPVVSGMGTAEARQVMVARLGALRQFNNAEVRHYERIEAEKAYVLRTWYLLKAAAPKAVAAAAEPAAESTAEGMAKGAAEGAAEGAPEGEMQIDPMTGTLVPVSRQTGAEADNEEQRAILRAHPRYVTLLRKWGLPQQALVRGAGDGTLGSQLVSITIRSNCIDTITAEPVTKKVPMSMTVKTLKMLACRAFGPAAPSVQAARLFYQPAGSADPLPMAMDQDDRELLFYCLQDGCRVLLQEVDEEAEAREQERAQREQREHLEKEIAQADTQRSVLETQRAQEARNVLASAQSSS